MKDTPGLVISVNSATEIIPSLAEPGTSTQFTNKSTIDNIRRTSPLRKTIAMSPTGTPVDHTMETSPEPGAHTQPTDMSTNTDVTLTTDLRGLRFAPPEIREKIFAAVFEDLTCEFPLQQCETPELLTALWERKLTTTSGWMARGDRELYEEAKDAFYKNAIFQVSWTVSGQGSWFPMHLIRRLKIDCRVPEEFASVLNQAIARNLPLSSHPLPFAIGQPTGPVDTMCEILSSAKNVTELHLLSAHGSNSDRTSSIYDKTVYCIRRLPNLSKVSVSINHYIARLGERSDSTPQSRARMMVRHLIVGNIWMILERLGTEFDNSGVIEETDTGFSNSLIKGSWEAEPGKKLVLKQGAEYAFSDSWY